MYAVLVYLFSHIYLMNDLFLFYNIQKKDLRIFIMKNKNNKISKLLHLFMLRRSFLCFISLFYEQM